MTVSEFKTQLKHFVSNKNTVTFLLVIVSIIVIYFAYNYLVNRAISPVNIPFSSTQINEKTQITNDMISTVKISGTFVATQGATLLQNKGQILNKYVKEGYQIPASSFFYQDAIVDEEESDKTAFDDLPDGYTLFKLPVDFHSTYGCSIMAGNYIDLYLKATDDDGKIIFDKFIKSIEVTKVVDSNGEDVFSSATEGEKPNPVALWFGVPADYHKLLRTATLISGNNIEIIPVPRNAGYSENPEETSIANPAIESFILSKAVYIAD